MAERGSELYRSVDVFKQRAYARVGNERLPAHIETTYGVQVAAVTELETGVDRLDLVDGRAWVARTFSAERPRLAAEGDAEILGFVAEQLLPAERCVDDPVSEHEGQPVLVTEYVHGRNARGDSRPELFRQLGDLLGRLHTLPASGGTIGRPAGSWHSLSIHGGGRIEDVIALDTLLADSKSQASHTDQAAFDDLRDAVASLDLGDGLPTALAHPDLCSANVIITAQNEAVLVDWTGAGTAPRVGPLGFLLATTGGQKKLVEAAIAGYRSHVALTDDELARLPDAIRAFPLVLDCWGVVYRNAAPAPVVAKLEASRRFANSVAALARQSFSNAGWGRL